MRAARSARARRLSPAQVCLEHAGLAHLIAKRYSWATASPALDQEDLTQSAFLGLLRARESFDAELAGFGYYGGAWARSCVRDEIGRMSAPVVAGAKVRKRMAETGEDARLLNPVRLDAPLRGSNSGATYAEVVATPDAQSAEDAAIESQTIATVRAAVRRLPPRDRLAVSFVAFQGKTLTQLAKKLGLTRQGAQHVYRRALEALRNDAALVAAHCEL